MNSGQIAGYRIAKVMIQSQMTGIVLARVGTTKILMIVVYGIRLYFLQMICAVVAEEEHQKQANPILILQTLIVKRQWP